MYSLFLTALTAMMVCVTCGELSHTRPFIPTTHSNFSRDPRASRTGLGFESNLVKKMERGKEKKGEERMGRNSLRERGES